MIIDPVLMTLAILAGVLYALGGFIFMCVNADPDEEMPLSETFCIMVIWMYLYIKSWG